MPRPTPRRSPAPSQFPNTSVNQFNRRKLLAGAGAALGAGVVLGGLGSAGVSALSRTSTGRLLQSSAAPVTFGSNYSDPVDSEAIAAAVEATGVPTTINTVDHNTYQENFNTYIQQPDDVVCWFAGYRGRSGRITSPETVRAYACALPIAFVGIMSLAELEEARCNDLRG